MYTFRISKVFTAVFFFSNLITTVNCGRFPSHCEPLSKKPYFDVEQVVGKSWMIYHTWNMKLENECFLMTFKKATQELRNRFYHDMKKYVQEQLDWNAASMVVNMGQAFREILLIAEVGAPAGTFIGIPNLVRLGKAFTFRSYVFRIAPPFGEVPILQFFMKLVLDGGGYLLVSDCNIGVTTLSARKQPRFRTEVVLVANSLLLGKGEPACVIHKKNKTNIVIQRGT